MSAWRFRAELVRVVDGDTLDLLVDLGFHLRTVQRFRLLGLDTPERGQPGYTEAAADLALWCREAIKDGSTIVVESHKGDSFGRWLADLHSLAPSGVYEDVTCVEWMRSQGWRAW